MTRHFCDRCGSEVPAGAMTHVPIRGVQYGEVCDACLQVYNDRHAEAARKYEEHLLTFWEGTQLIPQSPQAEQATIAPG